MSQGCRDVRSNNNRARHSREGRVGSTLSSTLVVLGCLRQTHAVFYTQVQTGDASRIMHMFVHTCMMEEMRCNAWDAHISRSCSAG